MFINICFPIFGDLGTYYTDGVMQLETMLNTLFLI